MPITGQNIGEFLLIVLSIFLGLYWLWLLLSSEKTWDWLLGTSDDWLPKPVVPREPSWTKDWANGPIEVYRPKPIIPRETRDFGTHINPLSLDYPLNGCDGLFERMDPRTWQCLKCHLLNFVELEPKGETKP
jgi:hypothetical protein